MCLLCLKNASSFKTEEDQVKRRFSSLMKPTDFTKSPTTRPLAELTKLNPCFQVAHRTLPRWKLHECLFPSPGKMSTDDQELHESGYAKWEVEKRDGGKRRGGLWGAEVRVPPPSPRGSTSASPCAPFRVGFLHQGAKNYPQRLHWAPYRGRKGPWDKTSAGSVSAGAGETQSPPAEA